MNVLNPLLREPLSFKMGQYTLSLETECTKEFEEKARTELRETPEVVQEATKKLRELIEAEPHLKVPTTDHYLITFLRPCKFYPESALTKIQNISKFRLKNKKICDNLLPSAVKSPFEDDLITILPKREQNGRRIVVIAAGKRWDPKKCSILEILRGAMLLVTVALVEPITQISGVVVIFDLNGLSMKHVLQVTPNFAATLLHFTQECLPLRLKAVHIVNQAYIFDIVFAIFKPFISAKLRNRIYFHGTNWKNLHSHINPEFLPVEFEGHLDIPPNTGIKLHELMCSFDDEFKDQDEREHNKEESTY